MTILHGQNVVASRNKLNELVGQFKGEKIRFEGKSLDVTQLKQALESHSLFGKDRLVIIENLFSCRPSKVKQALLEELKSHLSSQLIVWEGKKIDGRSLTSFKQAKVLGFTLPSVLFKFLGSLGPNNKTNSLELFHLCLKTESPELVFYMLVRQLSFLIIASDQGGKHLGSLPSWQKNKYITQSKRFTQDQLVGLYQQLLEIDYKQKTGRSPWPLVSQLDLLLATF